jgi:transcriptional regulator GlxA family with amidase domain
MAAVPRFAVRSPREGGTLVDQEDGRATNVGILLYDGVQVTDFTAPYDVFAMARPAGTPNPLEAPPLFRVFTVAQRETVSCEGGLRVLSDYRLDAHPPVEVLVVPGGLGVFRVRDDAAVMAWIRRTAETARLATSVCLGSLLMGAAGLLDGVPATTHWMFLDELRRVAPNAEVRGGMRYADAGKLLSSAGISAGIDMALHALERLQGPVVAAQTARVLEYDYWEGARAAEPVS